MTDEIFGDLVGSPPPIPRRPAHLRVTSAQLRSRLAAKSPEELDRLYESAREVYARVTSAPHVLRVCESPDSPEWPVDASPDPGPATDGPSLRLVHNEHPVTPVTGDVVAAILVVGGAGAGKTTFVTFAPTEPLPLPGSDEEGEPHFADSRKLEVAPDLELQLRTLREPPRSGVHEGFLSRALGTIVLADTTRLEEALPFVDYLRHRGVPFVVGLNTFDGIIRHAIKDVRTTLSIDDSVPVKRCDARDRESVKELLVFLVNYAMGYWTSSRKSVPPQLRMVVARLLA